MHLSQVRAVDPDGPPNNFIIYSIVSGDPKQQFSIDSRSGLVTVRSTLDREEVGFTFTPESLARAHTHLFYQGFSCICWILWSQMNIVITTVRIWLLLLNVGAMIFLIPLTRPLAFQITHYSLTVQAADEGDPPLSSAVQVTVTVSDVNDNPPLFSQINHSLVLQVKTHGQKQPFCLPACPVS